MSNSKLQTIYIGIHESNEKEFNIHAQMIHKALMQGRARAPLIRFFTTAGNEIWTEKL